MTFIFLKHFSGCNQPTFFDQEKGDDQLSLLRSGGGDKKIDLTPRSNCQINTINSWYMDCDGKKVKVESTGVSMENMFEIDENRHDYDLEV